MKRAHAILAGLGLAIAAGVVVSVARFMELPSGASTGMRSAWSVEVEANGDEIELEIPADDIVRRPDRDAEVPALARPGTVLRGTVTSARHGLLSNARVQLIYDRVGRPEAPGKPTRSRPSYLCQSDDLGAFEFPIQMAGSVSLLVMHDEYSPQSFVLGDVTPDEQRDPVTVELGSGARLHGRRVAPDGAPVEGAVVVATKGALERRSAPSDEHGEFWITQLDEGSYALASRASPTLEEGRWRNRRTMGPGKWRLDVPTVTAGSSNLVLYFERGCTVRGRVRGAEIYPLGSVQARRSDEHAKDDGSPSSARAVIQKDGTFVFEDMRPGTWSFLAVQRDTNHSAVLEAVVSGAATEIELTVPRSSVLRGHVRFKGGDVVREGRVRFSCSLARGALHGAEHRARIEPDGRFEISGCPSGEGRLVAHLPRLGPSEAVPVRVPEGAAVGRLEIVMQFDRDPFLSGPLPFRR